jgi:hypothetical protein
MTLIHEKPRFFMVWNKDGGAPTVAHNTRNAATVEAERLAARYPGRKFIVLQAIDKISTPAPAPAPV